MHQISWLWGISVASSNYCGVLFFFVGKANSAQLCMVPRLHIR